MTCESSWLLDTRIPSLLTYSNHTCSLTLTYFEVRSHLLESFRISFERINAETTLKLSNRGLLSPSGSRIRTLPWLQTLSTLLGKIIFQVNLFNSSLIEYRITKRESCLCRACLWCERSPQKWFNLAQCHKGRHSAEELLLGELSHPPPSSPWWKWSPSWPSEKLLAMCSLSFCCSSNLHSLHCPGFSFQANSWIQFIQFSHNKKRLPSVGDQIHTSDLYSDGKQSLV